MTIMGLRTSENFVANERPKHWRAGYLLRYPNGQAPLTALTAAMKEEAVDDPEFHWWEKALDNRRPRVTVDIGASAAFTVENWTLESKANTFKRGDLLYVEATAEIVWVPFDPVSPTSLPVSRGFAGTTPAAVDVSEVNPYIKCIGSAYEEASSAPTGVNFDPNEFFNYTQIFRQTFEMSRTAMKTKLRTKEQVAEAKRECFELYNIGLEMAFWFGRKVQTTINSKPCRTTQGVFASIDSGNIVDRNGTALTMDYLETNILEPMFRYGSHEKMAFCGNRALLAINQCVRKNTQYNIQGGLKEYGMNVTRLVCPFGELVLKTHPLWNQMSSNMSAGGGIPVFYGLDSWLCALDMDDLRYRYLSDSDTKYQKVLTENGLDGEKSGYIGEIGLEMGQGVKHFLVKGLVAGAADS